jgi:uncharacterized protein
MKIQVKVKPNSRHQSILELEDGSFVICLKSPPIDGKANVELIKLLANRFDVPKSYITIKSGLSGKIKLIDIDLV